LDMLVAFDWEADWNAFLTDGARTYPALRRRE
jgi:hypothetical protein